MAENDRTASDHPQRALAAAESALQDAETVARSASDTTTAAHEAVECGSTVAARAKAATTTAVAAAASVAAEIAAREATAVQAEADARALEVAANAAVALETVAAENSEASETSSARRAAASVAATVAADVVAQAKLTDAAAARIAEAVSLAAAAAASAAVVAADTVDAATLTAQSSANAIAGSTAATEVASDVAVESSTHAAELARQQVALMGQAPLVTELLRALERDELRLHYQAIYSMTSGAVVAVEALLRWQHPTRGLLWPAAFLTAAEGPLLVAPVGDWVLETAISQAAVWQHALGQDAPTMWVNIACAQLGQRHLPSVVERLLTASGLAPSALGLEVTERQLARRADEVTSDLMALRELGVATAVDDFGTGYSSLDYLRRFTFDEIKIDRSFISGLDRDKTDTAVTASIIALGRVLDLTVVAEGVETHEQYERLQQLGCEVAQGYLLHRPAPADVLDALLIQAPLDLENVASRGPVDHGPASDREHGVPDRGQDWYAMRDLNPQPAD